ncbi:MAG: YeeE/YedE thiosulfate transporter family protein [Cellulosilyticaceae bacterium]
MKNYLNWKVGGILLGLTFFIAMFLVKPIGVSTQFSVTAGMAQQVVDKDLIYENPAYKTGYGSTNAYLDKGEGKLAQEVAEPMNYGLLFVIAMVLGGLLGSIGLAKETRGLPRIYKETISVKPGIRYVMAFIGGAISLFGARLAGGCTSGHMMSGISQTALSGMAFAVAVFAIAIPTALVVYRKRR